MAHTYIAHIWQFPPPHPTQLAWLVDTGNMQVGGQTNNTMYVYFTDTKKKDFIYHPDVPELITNRDNYYS